MSRRFSGNNLVCVRGEKTVFERLSFSIGDGDALVLRGPNGSGKSSLLRVMAGLLPTESGVLLWNGLDVAQDSQWHRASLHYVGHQNALKPLLAVAENLAFGGVAPVGRYQMQRCARSVRAGQPCRIAGAAFIGGTAATVGAGAAPRKCGAVMVARRADRSAGRGRHRNAASSDYRASSWRRHSCLGSSRYARH